MTEQDCVWDVLVVRRGQIALVVDDKSSDVLTALESVFLKETGRISIVFNITEYILLTSLNINSHAAHRNSIKLSP